MPAIASADAVCSDPSACCAFCSVCSQDCHTEGSLNCCTQPKGLASKFGVCMLVSLFSRIVTAQHSAGPSSIIAQVISSNVFHAHCSHRMDVCGSHDVECRRIAWKTACVRRRQPDARGASERKSRKRQLNRNQKPYSGCRA